MEFDEERLCRLNGKKPTARERWVALYRLWRIAHRHGVHQDMAAEECFRVLFSRWEIFKMLEDDVPTLSRVHWPKFIRRKHLAIERRRRLHGKHYEWLERDQAVARKMCEQGTEYTPEEVAIARTEVTRKIREHAAEKGISLPPDDEDLFRWLKHGP